VVGDDVVTVSVDAIVVSSILVAAVAAVLQVFHLLFDFILEPPRVGVRASDERNPEFSKKLSPLAIVIGVVAEADTSIEGVVVVCCSLRMGDLRCAKGARRLLAADPGVGLPFFLIADPGGLRGLPGVLEGAAAADDANNSLNALLASFLRTVPGGFGSVAFSESCLKCFLPLNSPKLGSPSSQDDVLDPEGDSANMEVLLSCRRAASNEVCKAVATVDSSCSSIISAL
jgi:hypothetical protein